MPRMPMLDDLFSTMDQDLWQLSCEQLAHRLPPQQFNTWIRPLPPASVHDEGPDGAVTASLHVPNRFKLDWIRSQYSGVIEGVMSEIRGRPVRLELVLSPQRPLMARAPAGPSGFAGSGGPDGALYHDHHAGFGCHAYEC